MSGRPEPLNGRSQPTDGLTPFTTRRYSAGSGRNPPHASRTLVDRDRRVPLRMDAAFCRGSSARAGRCGMPDGPDRSWLRGPCHLRPVSRSGTARALRHLPLDARDEWCGPGRRDHAVGAIPCSRGPPAPRCLRADRRFRSADLSRPAGHPLEPLSRSPAGDCAKTIS